MVVFVRAQTEHRSTGVRMAGRGRGRARGAAGPARGRGGRGSVNAVPVVPAPRRGGRHRQAPPLLRAGDFEVEVNRQNN